MNAIRQIRAALGLTQTEFGRRLGVSRQSVAYWEVGERRPDIMHAMDLVRLAHEADMTMTIPEIYGLVDETRAPCS